MIKYKVSFEITDRVVDFLSSDQGHWIESKIQLIERTIYEMDLELIKVTDFKIEIEKVEEND